MKKRVWLEQLLELTIYQQKRLLDLWNPERGDLFYRPKTGMVLLVEVASDEGIEFHDELIQKHECIPLLSIGQMIEIIQEYDRFVNMSKIEQQMFSPHLCDKLWEEVKMILTV